MGLCDRLKDLRDTAAKKFVCDLLRVRWIVSEDESHGEGELGVKIGPFLCWYYKWADPMVRLDTKYRVADKREFGEVVKSHNPQYDENWTADND